MTSTAEQDYSILITDDDPGVRESLRDIFVPHGYRTFLAESGEEALDIVRVHPVHVAVLDMHLPRLSGLETLALVRQMRAALPAILMSGDWDDNLMRRALSEHAFCVLAKPVSRHMVVHVVHKALQKFYNN
ncbi:response regulator [Paludisphaera sp.]|uniref:response regulator n=1 Tax=Paludisphaera sp. TaxID=2017432 RepID=UPI00301C16C3